MNIIYLPTSLACASLPFRDPKSDQWERSGGSFRLRIESQNGRGLPWGSLARIFVMWLAKEAKVTKKRRIEIAGSYASFLKSLGLGVDYKTRKRFKEQIERFLNARMSIKGLGNETYQIADHAEIWWDRRHPNDDTLFTTFIDLGAAFFEHCQLAMPVIAADVHRLQHSPFQIDIYTWLNHRFFTLRSPQRVSYSALQTQFGSRFKNHRHFRQDFQKNLTVVKQVFISANVESGKRAVRLSPSPTVFQKRGWNTDVPPHAMDDVPLVGAGNMGCPHPQNYPQSDINQPSLFQEVAILSTKRGSYPRVNGDAGYGSMVTPIWDNADAQASEWPALCLKIKGLSK